MVRKNKKPNKEKSNENKQISSSNKNDNSIQNNFDFKNFLIIFLSFLVIYLMFFDTPNENYQENIETNLEPQNTISSNNTNNLTNEIIEEETQSYTFFNSYFESLNESFNLKFPVISPIIDIFLVSLLTSFITVYLSKIVIGKEGIERRKLKREEMKTLRKKQMDLMKTNPNKAKEVNQELMKLTFDSMKESFNIKLILITMPILFIVFPFLSYNYNQYTDILFGFGWLGTYIIFSILNSLILNKLFKLH